MLFIRSTQEIWELKAAVLCCVGLFLMNANVLRMKNPADVPSILITLSTVMLLHLFRLKKIGAVHKTWQVIVNIFAYYVCNQIVIALIWEQFGAALGIFYGNLVKNPKVLALFVKNSVWLNIIARCFVYSTKLVVALLITYKSVKWSRALDYIFPWRRTRTYFFNACEIPMKYKDNHTFSNNNN
ncbi:uncharacterized protein Dwil_GK27524, partial [Drosophila willistoni]